MGDVVGLDIGGTKVLGVLVDADRPGEVLAEDRVPVPAGGDDALDAMARMALRLSPRPVPCGVGIAGLVDRSGTLRDSPHLPGLRGVDIGAALRDRLPGRPVHVGNDAAGAAWAEHRAGAGRGQRDLACIALGTGIGAGFVVDGRLLEGAEGFAGEPGHMVVDRSGPPCPCGRNGCWEQYASGLGLARMGRDAAAAGRLSLPLRLAGGRPEQVVGEHVVAAARRGDPEALRLLDAFAAWVALGIGNVVTLLDVTLVVVSGGLVDMGDLLIDPVRAAFAHDVMCPGQRRGVRIVAGDLGPRAAAIGAALLAARSTGAGPGGGPGTTDGTGAPRAVAARADGPGAAARPGGLR